MFASTKVQTPTAAQEQMRRGRNGAEDGTGTSALLQEHCSDPPPQPAQRVADAMPADAWRACKGHAGAPDKGTHFTQLTNFTMSVASTKVQARTPGALHKGRRRRVRTRFDFCLLC